MSSPKLFVLSEQFRDLSFPLTEATYSIGRTPATDIQIPDPTISSNHCILTKQEDGSYCITDNGSTNGTSVNEQKVDSAPVVLHNGDILMLGSVEVLYDNKEASSSASKIASKQTSVINLSDAQSGTVQTKMTNLGKKVNTKNNMDLRSRKRQNKMMQIFIGILIFIAVAVLIYVLLGTSHN